MALGGGGAPLTGLLRGSREDPGLLLDTGVSGAAATTTTDLEEQSLSKLTKAMRQRKLKLKTLTETWVVSYRQNAHLDCPTVTNYIDI